LVSLKSGEVWSSSGERLYGGERPHGPISCRIWRICIDGAGPGAVRDTRLRPDARPCPVKHAANRSCTAVASLRCI
jgi:hypothetical protein